MLKRTYNVIYRVRPNKKTKGVRHVQNLTFNGKLKGNEKNAAKMLRALCFIHRVNPDAIVIERIELIRVRLAPVEWIKNLFKSLFGKDDAVEVLP